MSNTNPAALARLGLGWRAGRAEPAPRVLRVGPAASANTGVGLSLYVQPDGRRPSCECTSRGARGADLSGHLLRAPRRRWGAAGAALFRLALSSGERFSERAPLQLRPIGDRKSTRLNS